MHHLLACSVSFSEADSHSSAFCSCDVLQLSQSALGSTRQATSSVLTRPFAEPGHSAGVILRVVTLGKMRGYNWTLKVVWTIVGAAIQFGQGRHHRELRVAMQGLRKPWASLSWPHRVC